ncbi:RxLR-like protein [Plasmopara halstedii]|uniref:RxLR-like protein n=1 Tax=Plasmopara halstedii TaxID=4781 RepID=A0A0P1AXS4_PLAHL|nr:RxLR-like protein [Plasmopara halstedii]CEG46860.1 RxLR-like protein [Plasmopara halstedii]|eukprot:XP_024583229.1 RxLR-like protein [Plasmopara halstedii]
MNQFVLVALTAALLALHNYYIEVQHQTRITSPQLKLTYFDGRGRAELSRLILAAGNVSFIDERLDREAFLAIKSKLPLGQVPVLEVDGTTYSQSMAIARYAAKITGLYPQDPLECLRVDMVSESLVDVRMAILEIKYRTPDEAARNVKTKKLLDESLPKTLKLLEGFVHPGPFFMGDNMTYADIQLFDLIMNGMLDISTNFALKDYPNLAALVEMVQSNPNVAAYLAKL